MTNGLSRGLEAQGSHTLASRALTASWSTDCNHGNTAVYSTAGHIADAPVISFQAVNGISCLQQISDCMDGDSSQLAWPLGNAPVSTSMPWCCRSCKAYYLNRNNFGPKGTAVLAHAFKWNEALFRLNLSGNPIGVEGARALVELVMTQVRVPQLCP